MNQLVLTEALVPPQLTVKDFYMTGGSLLLNSSITSLTTDLYFISVYILFFITLQGKHGDSCVLSVNYVISIL